ncbi:MAG: protein kinase, partial [Myxococcota bacterium]
MDELTEVGERDIATAMEAQLPAPDAGLSSRATEATANETAPAKPERLAPGERVGRYLVLEVLGAGAMGVVYQAYDPELQRPVALKVVNPVYASRRDPAQIRSRLVAEARSLAKLTHPNVTVIHDVGEHDGKVWLAMELVEGVDVERWLEAESRPWPDIVAVFAEAARGLAAAHAVGIVHRDFKPANV